MTGDQKFWVSIWAMVALVIVSITCSAMFYYHNRDAQLVEMVKAGADPLAAKCALIGEQERGETAMCVLVANGNNNE